MKPKPGPFISLEDLVTEELMMKLWPTHKLLPERLREQVAKQTQEPLPQAEGLSPQPCSYCKRTNETRYGDQTIPCLK